MVRLIYSLWGWLVDPARLFPFPGQFEVGDKRKCPSSKNSKLKKNRRKGKALDVVPQGWSSITHELLLEIFANLDAKNLLNIGRVCKNWRAVSADYSLKAAWKSFLTSRWDSKEVAECPPEQWCTTARFYLTVKSNLKADFCQATHFQIPAGDAKIMNKIEIKKGVILIEFDNNSTTVLDLADCRQVPLLNNKSQFILFDVIGDHLLTLSAGLQYNVWSLVDGTCLQTLDVTSFEGYREIEMDLTKTETVFVNDSPVLVLPQSDHFQVWNFKKQRIDSVENSWIEDEKKYSAYLCCIKIYQNRVFAGYTNGSIKIWDPKEGKFIKTFETPNVRFKCMDIRGDKIFAGYDQGIVKIWDIPTAECLKDIDAKSSAICSIRQVGGLIIVQPEKHQFLLLLDVLTGQHLRSLPWKQGLITEVKIARNQLYVANKFTRNIWDMASWKTIRDNVSIGNILDVSGDAIINSTEEEVSAFDAVSGEVLASFEKCSGISGVAFHQGKLVYKMSDKRSLYVFDYTATINSDVISYKSL